MFADNADYKYPFDQGVVEFEKAYSFFIQNISLPAAVRGLHQLLLIIWQKKDMI